MPSIQQWITTGAAAALLGGCMHAHFGTVGANPPQAGVSPAPAAPRLKAGSVSGATIRTVCRSSGIPGGYVATDYLASRDCSAIKDRMYNAMVVEDISANPIGSTVLICAGQRAPNGWVKTFREVEPSSQCPREREDNSTSSTVMEIVRRDKSV